MHVLLSFVLNLVVYHSKMEGKEHVVDILNSIMISNLVLGEIQSIYV